MNTSTILCILDGFGLSPASPNNAVSEAIRLNKIKHIPLLFNYPWITLDADGESVGQEHGLVGNSEVGHMNIGGLAMIPQLSFEITQSSASAFEPITKTHNQVYKPSQVFGNHTHFSQVIHLIGLFSTGTIHSDMRHWIGAIEAALNNSFDSIVLHLFTDGRDSDKKSLVATWEIFEKMLVTKIGKDTDKITLGSVVGRFFGMDRDTNWDRTDAAMIAIQEHAEPTSFSHIQDSLQTLTAEQYQLGIFDENIPPTSLGKGLESNDVLWFINFRTDRAKQIMTRLVQQHSGLIMGMNAYGIGYEREIEDNSIVEIPQLKETQTKNTKEEAHSYIPLFKTHAVTRPLAKVLSEQALTQLHIAETEKYAHVTFFLNGGQNIKFKNEEWCLIPSHKVNSHAEQPAMRAREITSTIIDSLNCTVDIVETEEDQVELFRQLNIALYTEVVDIIKDSKVDFISEHSQSIDSALINSTYSRWEINTSASHESFERMSCFIYESGEMVGLVDYGLYFENKELFLFNLYILPQYRSRGLASFVLEYLENICVHNACSHIGLWCLEGNDIALNLYYSKGYQPAETKMMEWYNSENELVCTTQSQYLKKQIQQSNTLSKHYDVIIANYANPDMLGHTGNMEAAIKSMEVLDEELGKLIDIVQKGGHTLIITADHGNIEKVGSFTDSQGNLKTDTEHNANNVPLIIISPYTQEGLSTVQLPNSVFLENNVDAQSTIQSIISQGYGNRLTVDNWLLKDQIPAAQFALWHAGLITLFFATRES